MYSGYSHYNRQTAGNRGTEINDPNNTWFQQEPHWILIEDLLGGTYQMRSKHRKYLMQEPSIFGPEIHNPQVQIKPN